MSEPAERVLDARRAKARNQLLPIAHEAHHRGQVALTLEQNALRLPEKVALGGLWPTWMKRGR